MELHKTPELLFSCCLLECGNIAYLTTRTLSGEIGGDAFRFVQIAEGGDPRCSASCVCCEGRAVGWRVVVGRGSHCLLKRCPSLLLALLTVKRQEKLYQAVGSTGLTACPQKWGRMSFSLVLGMLCAHFPQCLRRTSVPSNLRLRIRCRHVVPRSYVVLGSEYHRASSLWAPRAVRCAD